MNGELNYRVASLKDLDALVELQSKLVQGYESIDKFYALRNNYKNIVKKYFLENLSSKDSLFFLALNKGKIIGYIFCNYREWIPIFKFRKHVAILDVYVEPEFRRMRAAQRMFDEVKRFARKQSADFVVLDVDVGNDAAQGLYKKNGFKHIMSRMVLRLD